ncbi:hypothetical protein CKAN_01076700 [Cinnamomum micranthum f. kanehirae]|uniref:Wall-associated receptor kinase galacturonan-binding domain-containing protein n=1 Tax=Cinnamomum micranthum f. kanehirae TaxID=337451 RepID=A0A3S3Q9V3_9MAGN|nr:hypothetical protein CKAN_01076700 [Cinnamomum micranthum f. kanehirae]
MDGKTTKTFKFQNHLVILIGVARILLLAFVLLPHLLSSLAEPVLSMTNYSQLAFLKDVTMERAQTLATPFGSLANTHRTGYPGFQLTCDNQQQPILKLLASEYIIRYINYESQSFSVVDKRFC